MVRRLQVKPRLVRPPQSETGEKAPASPAEDSRAAPGSKSKFKFFRKRKAEGDKSTKSPQHGQQDSNSLKGGDADTGWEEQALTFANEFTGSPQPITPVKGGVKGPAKGKDQEKASSRDEGGGSLRFKNKRPPPLVEPAKKRKFLLSFSLPGIEANLVAAIFLFFAGTVLLAISMFGFGVPPNEFNSISFIGICVTEGLFIISTLHAGETAEIFSHTLIGAFTLFSALISVGVFVAEAFLVPTLGFALVENMPSAPITASATFVFSACLIVNSRTARPKWTVVFICLLAAAIIQLLPVQHFVSAHINDFTLDRLKSLLWMKKMGS